MLHYSDKVILPIGIEVDGIRYREVIIDEMTGVDEENLVSKKVRNNGAKAVTLLLQRCIQEVTGLIDRKSNSLSLIDERIVRNMYVADRDYLTICIRALSDRSEFESEVTCPSCNSSSNLNMDVKEMDVYDWDEESPAQIELELPRGFWSKETNSYHSKITWKFPKGSTQEKLSSLPEDQIATRSMLAGIVKVEGMSSLPTAEDVRRLSLRERRAFAEALSAESVGVDTKISLTCPDCSHEFSTEVSMMNFFNLGGSETKSRSVSGKSGRRLRKRT